MSRDARTTDDEDEIRPRGRRTILIALIAALVLVGVSSAITAIVVDGLSGGSGSAPALLPAGTGGGDEVDAVAAAEQRGYERGERDASERAKERLQVRYDQGYAKGFAEGRNAAENPGGEAGGYQEGYNAGVKAAVEAYQRIIEQAQRIIAQAGEEPVVPAPQAP